MKCFPYIFHPLGMCKSHLRKSRSDADQNRLERNSDLTLQGSRQEFRLIVTSFTSALRMKRDRDDEIEILSAP